MNHKPVFHFVFTWIINLKYLDFVKFVLYVTSNTLRFVNISSYLREGHVNIYFFWTFYKNLVVLYFFFREKKKTRILCPSPLFERPPLCILFTVIFFFSGVTISLLRPTLPELPK